VTILGLGISAPNGVVVNAGSLLWVAYLFGGALCFEKTMAADQRDDALAGLLLAPIDRGVLFFAKWIANLLLMIVIASVVTLAAVIFLDLHIGASPGQFMRIVLLGLAGFAAVGTLFSGVLASTRMHGGMLAVVILPLCLPLVLTSTRLLSDPGAGGPGGLGESILVAFNVVFVGAGFLTFDLLLEG
jgi:ABC-type transport system involved in cytochrome c biogenesis permease component